jgi:hypothetical protein
MFRGLVMSLTQEQKKLILTFLKSSAEKNNLVKEVTENK